MFHPIVYIRCMFVEEAQPVVGSKHSTPTHQPPIMTVSIDEKEVVQKVHQAVDENLMLLEEDKSSFEDDSLVKTTTRNSDDSTIYFRFV